MLNHQPQQTRTKGSRFLLKPGPAMSPQPKGKNIFSVDAKNHPQNLLELNNNDSTPNGYSICGDSEFKTKFFSQKKHRKNIHKEHSQINNPDQDDLKICSFYSLNKNLRNQAHNLQSTIHMNQSQHRALVSTLSKTQTNIVKRQCQNLKRFKQTQQSWRKIEAYLKNQIPKSQTVTFASVEKIYVHQNPQKLDVVNDMLPEYWRNSLRNNDKKLKSHLRGHKFKPQAAEEMLQTLKGTQKLEKSIPRIGLQRTNKIVSANIMLKANKIIKPEGCQTMRQFHKSMYHTLNESIKLRSSRDSTDKKLSRRVASMSRTMKTKFLEEDTEQLNNSQIKENKMLSFCNDLEKLDKIDNETYLKSYDTKHKWIHEGLKSRC